MLAHPRVGPKYHSLTRDDYPVNVIELVCFPNSCGGNDGRSVGDYIEPRYSNAGIPFCGYCKRPPHWFTYRCVSCDVVFIKDFLDPKFCSSYPHCWNCLPKLSWSYCPDHGSKGLMENNGIVYNEGTAFERVLHCHEPLGLNPKIYEASELDDLWAQLTGE